MSLRPAANPEGIALGALSVKQFCQSYGISRTTFYALVKDGRGPALMRPGGRTLISRKAAEAWERDMETGAKK